MKTGIAQLGRPTASEQMVRLVDFQQRRVVAQTARKSAKLRLLKAMEPFVHGNVDPSIDGGAKTGGCLLCLFPLLVILFRVCSILL